MLTPNNSKQQQVLKSLMSSIEPSILWEFWSLIIKLKTLLQSNNQLKMNKLPKSHQMN